MQKGNSLFSALFPPDDLPFSPGLFQIKILFRIRLRILRGCRLRLAPVGQQDRLAPGKTDTSFFMVFYLFFLFESNK